MKMYEMTIVVGFGASSDGDILKRTFNSPKCAQILQGAPKNTFDLQTALRNVGECSMPSI